MAKKRIPTSYNLNDYDYDKFNVGRREHGGYILKYGAYKATADQIRYYNYYTDPKTGNPYPNYQRPADAAPPKSYYSRPGYTRNRTPKAKAPKTKASKPQSLPKSITSKFPVGTDFGEYGYWRQGQKATKGNPFGNKGWGRPLGISGKEITNLESRPFRYGKRGQVHFTDKSEKYGAKAGRSSTCTIEGHAAFIRHLAITQHALNIQVHNFRVAVGKRAIKVFQDSFDMQRFNSAEGTPWASLAPFTQRKRSRRGTYPKPNPILREYLDLRDSIQGHEFNAMTYRVETKPIQKSVSKHKKVTGVWASLHNEGIGTYGKGFGGRPPKPYIQRKFMGHSTLLDINTDKFMSTMAKRFLFDAVFLVK